ncbi:MAG TPA: hypothetical protein VFS35_04460, partial [Terrimicrobiaceae bacterium]|nr:hypothetical protein [Terrimicrobiaceae bacterium]
IRSDRRTNSFNGAAFVRTRKECRRKPFIVSTQISGLRALDKSTARRIAGQAKTNAILLDINARAAME